RGPAGRRQLDLHPRGVDDGHARPRSRAVRARDREPRPRGHRRGLPLPPGVAARARRERPDPGLVHAERGHARGMPAAVTRRRGASLLLVLALGGCHGMFGPATITRTVGGVSRTGIFVSPYSY